MFAKLKLILIVTGLFVWTSCVASQAANNDLITVDLQEVSTTDALHILAKFLHQNIVLSPKVSGTASLYLQKISKEDAFELLLASHDLAKRKIGNTWFIIPRAELIQSQQEEVKQKISQDELEPLYARIFQIHYAKAEDIGKLLQEKEHSILSKRGYIQIDPRTNVLCVRDTLERLNEIRQVINRLDIPVKQVLIEARLVNIDQDYERQLGINFAVNAGNAINTHNRYSLAVARLANGSELDVQLAALENEGHGEVISSPSLFTANQQAALIESGEEIPYQEVSASGGTAVTFKKAVLSLKVVPQVLPNNRLLLQLQVNQDRPSNHVVLGVPAVNTRQISTNIQVNNCQTIVLGGIYESSQERAEQRIPFLSKIPLVGLLFKQQNVKQNKRELLIFVTPKIISQGRSNAAS